MTDFDEGRSEDQVIDAVAEALVARGLVASSQNTGGGINCVVLQRKDGGEIVWGTADVNWGAAIHDAGGGMSAGVKIDHIAPRERRDVAE